jgi:hypothetical protein
MRVGPRTALGVCEKSRPHRDSICGLSSPLRVIVQTTNSEITVLPEIMQTGPKKKKNSEIIYTDTL